MRKKLIALGVCLGIAFLAVVVWVKSRPEPMREGYDPKQNGLSADTRKVLETGDRFILLSLEPTHPGLRSESAPPPKETFHDYAVLGKTEILNPKDRTELLGALYQGIAESRGLIAACFNPRHGISAKLGDESVDLVICFECLSIQTYVGSSNGVLNRAANVFTANSPQPTFDRALKTARLPISHQ